MRGEGYNLRRIKAAGVFFTVNHTAVTFYAVSWNLGLHWGRFLAKHSRPIAY